MTFYVQRKVFSPGDVGDAEDLMGEFYNAAATLSSIDQNNLAKNSIHYSVALPPDPVDTSDRQRGPFVCYDDLANIATGLLFSTNSQCLPAALKNGAWSDVSDVDFELNFTSRVPATYTFMFHATVYSAYNADTPVNLDAVLKLNGSPIGSSVTVSGQTHSGTRYVPIFIQAEHFIEPKQWNLTVAFRPRMTTATLPTIQHMTLGVMGFIR